VSHIPGEIPKSVILVFRGLFGLIGWFGFLKTSHGVSCRSCSRA